MFWIAWVAVGPIPHMLGLGKILRLVRYLKPPGLDCTYQ